MQEFVIGKIACFMHCSQSNYNVTGWYDVLTVWDESCRSITKYILVTFQKLLLQSQQIKTKVTGASMIEDNEQTITTLNLTDELTNFAFA